MKMYPDPEKWAERLKNVPSPLRQKALNELDAAYLAQGFKARSNGKDANGTYIEVDIKPGTGIKQLYDFLQSTDMAAVTVEPIDIERLYGKTVGTLGFRRSIEINGAAAVGLELIEPNSLVDALTVAGNVGVDWSGFVDAEAVEKFITNDMVSNGLLSERDAAATDEWMEKPEPVGLRIGDRAEYADMGEFAPDYEVEEWGEEF